MPRFYCPAPLIPDTLLELPAGAARHVQVLRLQPGTHITLFNQGPDWTGPASDGEFEATITQMGRSNVQVCVGAQQRVERAAPRQVHLAVGMPANERMDWLVEKAVEIGVASIQPLMTERSVLRLSGERADKKVAHWQSIAIAASEQCGGNCVPRVHPVTTLARWLPHWRQSLPSGTQPWLLSLLDNPNGTTPWQTGASMPAQAPEPVLFLSGPEGGFGTEEEAAAVQAGFQPLSLGVRVLRAETAALTALARLACA